MTNDATAAPSEGFIYPEPTEAMRLAFYAARGSWFDKMRAALAVVVVGGIPAKAHIRHLKRGSVYAVLGEATAQVSVGTDGRLLVSPWRAVPRRRAARDREPAAL